MDLARNLAFVRSRIGHQTIVAATKSVGAETIAQLVGLGVTDIAENLPAAFLAKKAALAGLPIRWHFIGHLQSNKAKGIIEAIDCLHSLDSLNLAREIQKRRPTPLDCFVEVHVSGEPSKNGVEPEFLLDFVAELAKYDKIRVVGLMGMAAATTDPTRVEAAFSRLASLRDAIAAKKFSYAPCHDLSMGMSDDYEIAVRCGATHLRLGTILFRNEVGR